MLIQTVKRQLIKRGMLESESALSMEGVQIVKYIDDFKKAVKYVKLGSILIGIKDKKTAVLLLRKGIPVEYEFQALNLDDFYPQLCEFYSFLKVKQENSTEVRSQEIGYEELQEVYGLSADNTLYLSTYKIEDKRTTDEIFFSVDRELFFYDRKTGLLLYPFSDAEKLIRERVA